MKIKSKHNPPEDREGANYSHFFAQMSIQASTSKKIYTSSIYPTKQSRIFYYPIDHGRKDN